MEMLLKQLYGMLSMTAMDAKIEEQLQQYQTLADREVLQKIYESNDLDERCALCALHLGYEEQAGILLQRLEAKRERKFANYVAILNDSK